MQGKLLPLLSVFLLYTSTSFSQVHVNFGLGDVNERNDEQCAHTTIHEARMAQDPAYAQEQRDRERILAQLVAQYDAGLVPKNDDIITIPLVVHIIHKGEAYGVGTNITDEQIFSAVNGLNEDFRKVPGTWGDGDGVDIHVEFCLAQRDPDGNSTTGINRVNGCTVTNYCEQGITAGQGQGAAELAVKNLSRWPNQQYYNVWVVSEIENNNGGSGIQGYAYFPTTVAVDGTVVLYNAFGTVGNLKSYTNRNRTLTHELGHAFALFHTFQGASCDETDCTLNGDRVCDTPPTILNSNCASPACGGTQQVANYLDYTSQLCKNMFTDGQRTRMRLSIMNSRANLMQSNGCEPVGVTLADAAITAIAQPEGTTCSNQIAPVVTLNNAGATSISAVTIEYRTSGAWLEHSWTGSLGAGQSVQVTLPTFNGGWGNRTLQVRTQNPNGNADANPANDELSKAYTAVQNGNTLTLSLTLDNNGAQTTWLVRNGSGVTMRSGGPYSNGQGGTVHTVTICLPDGCYELVVNDSGNNGMCCANGNGSFSLTQNNGVVLASGGQFTAQSINPFCVPNTALPVANFAASPTQVCAGGSTAFTNTSAGQVDTYAWQFPGGNPATSTLANPGTVTYASAGTYSVTLTATNAGGSHSETKTNYITVLANQTWYADNDGDGYGNPLQTIVSCTQPTGYVGNAGDCDDTNPNDWDSCYDCAGTINGNATLDDCGTCDSDPDNDCSPCDELTLMLVQSAPPSCHNGSNGSIQVLAQSPNGTPVVSWNTGATGTQLSNIGAGTYTATATLGDCEVVLVTEIAAPAPLVIQISNLQHVGCEEVNTGAVTIGASGGTGNLTINALGQNIAPGTYSGLGVGTYTITVTDANGCVVTAQVNIVNIPCEGLEATSVTQPFCNNSNLDFFTAVHCTPVTAAIEYHWSFERLSANGQFTLITETPYFVAANIADIIPFETYSVVVKGWYPEVDSDWGEACNLAFGIRPSALIAEDCGNLQLSLSSWIGAEEVEAAEQYEFRFEDSTTGERTYGYAAASLLQLNAVPDLEVGVSYLTDVRVRYRNMWGPHGQSCTISMSHDDLVPSFGSGVCGNLSFNAEKDTLHVQPLNGATVYAIEFNATVLTTPVELQSNNPYFVPAQFTHLPKGEVLTVRTRANINGTWTPWSSTCQMGFGTENETDKYTLNMFLYPNPIRHGQALNARMNGDWIKVELTLYNLAGLPLRKVQSNFAHMQPNTFELPDIEAGIYFVTAVHGTSTLTKKLIVQ